MTLTRSKLEGRDLGAGLGLAAFELILLPWPTSGTALILLPSPELTTLLGLAAFFTDAAAGLGGGACSTMVMVVGRTNIPLPISQSKYRSPRTLPSFLPLLSSNSTPTQSPVWKWVSPMYLTVARRPSGSSTIWPTCRSDMLRKSSKSYIHRFQEVELSSSKSALLKPTMLDC